MTELARGQTNLGAVTPEQLFAGDAPVVTDWANVATDGSTSFQKFEVVAINRTTDTIIKYVPGGSGDQTVAAGIVSQPINPNTTGKVGIFVGGFFNHEQLVWEASVTTLIARKKAFARTPIYIGSLHN